MPTRPPRACKAPGCPLLTTRTYCNYHEQENEGRKRQRRREYDRARGGARQRGYGKEHERWRRAVLGRDPWCRNLFGVHQQGEKVASEEAHHLTPVRDGGEWVLSNGAGLCGRCHRIATAREKQDRARSES